MAFVFPVNTRNRSKFFHEQVIKNRNSIEESHARDTARRHKELEVSDGKRSSLSIRMTYKEELKRVLHDDATNGDYAFFNKALKSEYIGHLEEKNSIERADAIVAACHSLKERGTKTGMEDLATEVWKNMKALGKADQEANAVSKAIQYFQNKKEAPTIKALNEQTRKNLHVSSAPVQPGYAVRSPKPL